MISRAPVPLIVERIRAQLNRSERHRGSRKSMSMSACANFDVDQRSSIKGRLRSCGPVDNFAECAREMIVTGKYLSVQIDFQPFWEKPPLFIWMQVCCMKLFGISEFAARLPNAICGIFTLLFLFETGRKLYDNSFAWLWVMVYAGSVLPFFLFQIRNY